MKRTLILIATVALCASLIAQSKMNNATLQAVPIKMEQHNFGNGVEYDTGAIPALRSSSMLSSDKLYHTIGETYYNTPTNCNARKTIGFHSKSSTGAAVWTMAQSSSSRGTGINYYNVNDNSWEAIPNPETGRVETVKTGWGAHGFTEAGEIVVSHDGANGLIVNTRDKHGEGSWQQSTLVGPQYLVSATPTGEGIPSTAILWPTMATNGNTVHLVCVTNTWPTGSTYPSDYEPNPNLPPYGYLGFTTLPLYYRSTDGGKTWEAPRNFREYGMTNFECFRVYSDQYTLTVRENHVVLLYNNQMGFINYLESKDGGDTWKKKTVYDNGMVFTQKEALVEPRLVPTSSSVYIDENHKVHVVFSTQCYTKDAGTNDINYWANLPIGMIYWNDEHKPIDWQELRGWREGNTLKKWNWETYSGYIELPSVVGLNKYYTWEGAPVYNQKQFNDLGWAIYPTILAKEGRVFVAYQSPLDYPLIDLSSGTPTLHRGIFITVSEDYGKNWEVQKNTSWISYHPKLAWIDWSEYIYPEYDADGNPIYSDDTIYIENLFENAYPSLSYNYKGDSFMLQWTSQYSPFIEANGFQNDPIDILTFSHNLKNIPAYKNIQEVYKGLWNGSEMSIQEQNHHRVNIFPNPANDKFTITNDELNITKIEIFDVSGRKLSTNQLIATSSHHLINISHLQSGIYFVKIYSKENQIITKQLVVIK